jgi:hypothetical protein
MSTDPSESLSYPPERRVKNQPRKNGGHIGTYIHSCLPKLSLSLFPEKRNKETSDDNIPVESSPLFSRGKRVGN